MTNEQISQVVEKGEKLYNLVFRCQKKLNKIVLSNLGLINNQENKFDIYPSELVKNYYEHYMQLSNLSAKYHVFHFYCQEIDNLTAKDMRYYKKNIDKDIKTAVKTVRKLQQAERLLNRSKKEITEDQEAE